MVQVARPIQVLCREMALPCPRALLEVKAVVVLLVMVLAQVQLLVVFQA